MKRRSLVAALATLPWPAARAQAPWPSRPIRLIEPGTPGNGNDTVARLFAIHLERILGQPLVVDNRGGAGGRIGVEAAWRSAPDGYTLLIGNAGSNGINAAIYRDLPYDLATAFEPISQLVAGPNVLVVNRTALPARDVAGLVALLKARPGDYNYASGGVGSSSHLSMELLKLRAGVDVVHVPYRGSPAVAQAIMQGDAPVAISNLVNVMPFIQRGEIAALAVTSLARWPELPDVPTLHESGFEDFETLAWTGLLAPPGTPRAVVERVHAAAVRVAASPEVQDRVRLLGGALVASTPEEFGARIRADITQWRDVVSRANIRPE